MDNKRYVLITAVGRDRPGLVAGLASTVAELQGNIEDLDEVVMRGVFIINLLVSLEGSSSLDELKHRLLAKGGELGLKVMVHDPAAEGWLDEASSNSSRV